MSRNAVDAIERITRECYRSFSRFPNARLIDDGRVYGVRTDVPINFFSGIATTNGSADDVPRLVEEMRPAPFRWWVSPSTRPANLAAVLEHHGFRHTYDAPGMMADLATVDFHAPMPAGLTVERVRALDDWDAVFMEGFERPEHERGVWKSAYSHCDDAWVHFVGYLEDVPVATTSVLLCGDLAGIYHVVTLRRARGRGIGKAMTTTALRHAKNTGATHAALQSSELGLSVYRAIGFVQYCDLTLYDWRSSSVTA